MIREIKEEEREDLEDFRYLQITGDCYIHLNGYSVPLKRGDIIKIYNSQLENLVFDKRGGILFEVERQLKSNNTNGKLRPSLNLEKYPDDEPFDLIKYLSMQPNIHLTEPLEVGMGITSSEWVYLTPKIVERMLNDDENEVKLKKDSEEKVGKYNKSILKEYAGVKVQKVNSKKIKLLGLKDNKQEETDNSVDKEPDIETLYFPEKGEEIQPGVYKTIEGYIPVTVFFKEGDVIDFSDPEYILLLVDQDFMRVLANSHEITDLKMKKRIQEDEETDFLIITDEADEKLYEEYGDDWIYIEKKYTRFYRINDDIDIDIESVSKLSRIQGEICRDDFDIGYGYDCSRVCGKIEAIESEGKRVSIIKVEYDNPAIYSIMDKELQKISTRLTKQEAYRAYIKRRSEKQKKDEEKRKSEAEKKGIKNYDRIKMIAELAAYYVKNTDLTDDFIHKAFEYDDAKGKREKKKLYDILRFWPSSEELYRMHELSKNDTRKIEAMYRELLGQNRGALTNIFKSIAESKEDEQR